jgi:hypothetical protein
MAVQQYLQGRRRAMRGKLNIFPLFSIWLQQGQFKEMINITARAHNGVKIPG